MVSDFKKVSLLKVHMVKFMKEFITQLWIRKTAVVINQKGKSKFSVFIPQAKRPPKDIFTG